MKKNKIRCPYCGTVFEKGRDKCPNCGVSVERMKLKKTEEEYKKDAEGKIVIDTSDVTYFDNRNYSVKKARGDDLYCERPLWWEIYKWADLLLARRKIKKAVKKESVKLPNYINNSVMFVLCLFLGLFGVHRLYAKNYKSAIILFCMLAIGVVAISVEKLAEIMGSFIGGGFLFFVVLFWLVDLFKIAFKKYGYHDSKMAFIDSLSRGTKSRLSIKYLSKEDQKIVKERRALNKEKRLEEIDKAKEKRKEIKAKRKIEKLKENGLVSEDSPEKEEKNNK